MQIADYPAERYLISNDLDGMSCFVWSGQIIKHLQDAGENQDQDQEYSQTTSPEGKAEAGLFFWNCRGMEMM